MQQGFRWLLVLSLLATFIVVTPSAVHAATVTVTTTADSGDGSLRQAVSEAAAGDTIAFNIAEEGPHTITLTSGQITIDKHLTISGPGAAQLTIARSSVSVTSNFRIFSISSGSTVTINALAVEGGFATGAGEAAKGGGIYNAGTLTITNSTVSGNYAMSGPGGEFTPAPPGFGGGIHNIGTLTVSGSTISDNFAVGTSGTPLTQGSSGGGISNQGTLTVTGSTISGNNAADSGGGIFNGNSLSITGSTLSKNSAPTGGGIANGSLQAVTLSRVILHENTATIGGGIYNGSTLTVNDSILTSNAGLQAGGGIYNGSTLTVSNSNLTDNTTPGSGGGILNSSSGELTIASSTLSKNSAATGGGIRNDSGGRTTITSSTLSGNTATNGAGGGISNLSTPVLSPAVMITSSTLSKNSAATGGGIHSVGDTILLTGVIVADNTATTSSPDVAGGLFEFITGSSYNLIGDDSGMTGTSTSSLVGTADESIDPMLGPLQDNGGPTQTHALLPGSPAIDTGGSTCPAADQRGAFRPQGAACDIGAYEAGNLFVVTNTNDSGTGSLRQAILGTNDRSGADTIIFAPHVAGTITLDDALPTITDDLTITGPAAALAISGAGSSRVLQIAADKEVTIDRLTIKDGDADSGGGIWNSGTLTISNSTISDNTASDNGGGIWNSGTITITTSTISGNTASDNGGGIWNSGTLAIASSTVSGNTATSGGGIYNQTGGALTLTSTIVAGNIAPTSPDLQGAVAAGSASLIGDGSGMTGMTGANLIGTASEPIDPMLGPLQDNGGPTETHTLLSGSPAIDAGGSVCPEFDQRGVQRPMGTACDVGAYEGGNSFLVTNTNDSGSGSLRQAILGANVNSGADTITFASNVTGTIVLTSGQLSVTDHLTITGPGSGELAVSGNSASRVFANAGGIELTIDGLTIKNGSEVFGGGIENAGTLTIVNSVVSGNSSSQSGAGIHNSYSGTLTVLDTTFSGNVAQVQGGGIANSAMSGTSVILGKLTVTNSTFSGNNAGVGGGISNIGELTVTNSTFSGNNASFPSGGNGGGGIFNNATLTLVNSTITGNSASGDTTSAGGGIYNYTYGTLTLTSTIVAGNTAPAGPDVQGAVTAGSSNNLIGDGSGTTGLTGGNQVGTTAVPVDPKLGLLQDNGGPTRTHALLSGSPALDAGGKECPDTDQRGVVRPATTNNPCDIGAFEVPSPTLSLPSSITVPATSVEGATVSFSASATDWAGEPLNVVCDPASGSKFALGNTPVDCSATDEYDHNAEGSFTVTVNLPAAPTISVPDDMLVEATSLDGAVVTFAPSATDWNSAALTVTCDPVSGTTFPLGETTVNCSATDEFERTADDSFTITVQDTTAPVLSQPANLTVDATGPNGAIVSYNLPGVTEAVDENVTVVCNPPPGSLFPTGTTLVTCSASDAAGNDADPVSFTVTVLGGSGQLSVLINDVRTGPGSTLVKSRLLVMLQAADLSLRRGQTSQSCTLLAGFATTVHLYGAARLIPASTAAAWRADALQIRAALGCR